MPGSGGSEATTGPLTGQISTAGQIHTEQETRQEALSNIGVLGGRAGGASAPPGKNILLGRTELGSLAEKKLTV